MDTMMRGYSGHIVKLTKKEMAKYWDYEVEFNEEALLDMGEFWAAKVKEDGGNFELGEEIVGRITYHIDGKQFVTMKQEYESRPDGSLWLKNFSLQQITRP